MKNVVLLLLFIGSTFTACTPGQLQQVLDQATKTGGLTNAEVASGLKQALDLGITNGVKSLSSLDGFYKTNYKILLPEEAQQVVEKLKFIPGFQQVEEIAIEKINRAAEDAAAKATPIFKNAITSMTFDDAMNILLGSDNAATNYLNNRTNAQLYQEFHPVIMNSLNKFGAIDYWADAVNAYNKIPLVQKLNPELDDYVTQKSLTALFDMVAKKEAGIRNNVSQRTTDLLKKVFARQDG